MYFEAVEDLTSKLAETTVVPSRKAELARQLSDVDPDGRIRAFLSVRTASGAEAVERPDLTDLRKKFTRWDGWSQ